MRKLEVEFQLEMRTYYSQQRNSDFADVVAGTDDAQNAINTSTFTHFLYLLIVGITVRVALVSDIFIISQAVHRAPSKDWKRNGNAIVIGAAYVQAVSSLFT